MNVLDKISLGNSVKAIGDVNQVKRTMKAVSVARAVDFFTQLRKDWGEWEKIRRRILAIMGKYLESRKRRRKENELLKEKIIAVER